MRKLFVIFLLFAFCFAGVSGEKRIVGARVNNQVMLLRVDLANYQMDCSTDGTAWSAVSGTSGAALLTGADFTGNVSVAGSFTASGTVSVPNNAFALSKIAQISTGSLLGNVSGSTGNVTTLSASDVKTLIGNATTSAAGLMSGMDKVKLDGLAFVAVSGSYSDLINRPSNATASSAGLMSGTDKAKLDGLASVAASGSYSDLINKPSNATASSAGLMSGTDKAKLDGLASVAASGSYSDLINKPSNATVSAAGLMSATDKSKLDGLVSGYKGYYAAESALKTAYTTGTSGDYAIVGETGTVWAWIGSAWANTSIASLSWSSITGKPAVLAQYDGTVSNDGAITLADSVVVSDISAGSMVRFTAANTVLGTAAGDLYQKISDSAVVETPDPTKVNVNATWSASGTYILWNPYSLNQSYGTSGSERRWLSSNSTFSLQYGNVGGFSSRWIVQWNGVVFAYADDDGSHDPWDPSLVWYSNDSNYTNFSITEGTSEQTVLNNISQFIRIQAYKEATASAAGLMSSSDKTKLNGLSVDTVAASETTVTASYTADWDTATIHRIKTTASTACALTVQDIPLGKALTIRVDNTAAGSVAFNSSEIVPASNAGIIFLTFINVTGSIEQKK